MHGTAPLPPDADAAERRIDADVARLHGVDELPV
jgi:hypothetical protein